MYLIRSRGRPKCRTRPGGDPSIGPNARVDPRRWAVDLCTPVTTRHAGGTHPSSRSPPSWKRRSSCRPGRGVRTPAHRRYRGLCGARCTPLDNHMHLASTSLPSARGGSTRRHRAVGHARTKDHTKTPKKCSACVHNRMGRAPLRRAGLQSWTTTLPHLFTAARAARFFLLARPVEPAHTPCNPRFRALRAFLLSSTEPPEAPWRAPLKRTLLFWCSARAEDLSFATLFRA